MNSSILVSCVVLFSSFFVLGCAPSNRDGAHQFMRIEMIHEGGRSPTDVTYLHDALLSVSSNRFSLETDECERRLRRIEEGKLRMAIRAFNSAEYKPQVPHERAIAMQVQCIKSLPMDKDCLARVMAESKKIAAPQEMVDYIFASGRQCSQSYPVGIARLTLANAQ